MGRKGCTISNKARENLHRRANQLTRPKPNRHNFTNFGLSRRQSKPLASSKKKCTEKWCICKTITPLPPSQPKRRKPDDRPHAPRLRLLRLKIQEHLRPTIKKHKVSRQTSRESVRERKQFPDCRKHVLLESINPEGDLPLNSASHCPCEWRELRECERRSPMLLCGLPEILLKRKPGAWEA